MEPQVVCQVVCQVAACLKVACLEGLELPLRPVVALDQLLRKSTNSEILLSAEQLEIKHISLLKSFFWLLRRFKRKLFKSEDRVDNMNDSVGCHDVEGHDTSLSGRGLDLDVTIPCHLRQEQMSNQDKNGDNIWR